MKSNSAKFRVAPGRALRLGKCPTGAIVQALEGLKMSYPAPDKAHRKELESIRETLANEKD